MSTLIDSRSAVLIVLDALAQDIQRVATTLRPNDVLRRFGGEELVDKLPETNGSSAKTRGRDRIETVNT